MMNVEAIRATTAAYKELLPDAIYPDAVIMHQYISDVEALLSELDAVKAERDRAINGLLGNCKYCKDDDVCPSNRQGSHKNCWKYNGGAERSE